MGKYRIKHNLKTIGLVKSQAEFCRDRIYETKH
jgi:hypothetical protein